MRRAGLPLALFAIVFQALVSFGHHHFDLFGSRALSLTEAGSGLTQTAPAVSNRLVRRSRQAPTAPHHEQCLICVAIHVAAHPVVGAPQVTLPLDANGAPVPEPAFASISLPPRVAAFESRGPPLS